MAAQEWRIEGPRILDIGDEGERVTRLDLGMVAGRVDVVTHDDSPTARVEVTEVEGLPVIVRWESGRLKVVHGKEDGFPLMEMLKRTVESFQRNRAVISISVPVDTRTSVSTVSATAVVTGVHAPVAVNTVSGTVTLSDLVGPVDLNTVSGPVEGEDLDGPTSVNTVSGAVTLQSSRLPRVDANTVSGDIALDLTGAAARISSTSVSGDVTVRAPLAGFDVEGHTATGQVVVDGRTLRSEGRGFAARLGGGGRLTEGDGALKVTANAVSGNVVVLRATAPQDAARPAEHGPQDGDGGPQDRPVPSGEEA